MTINHGPNSSLIQMPCYRQSQDGLFWPRYPNGDRPGPGMAGVGLINTGAAGQIITGIPLSVQMQILAAGQGNLATSSPGGRINFPSSAATATFYEIGGVDDFHYHAPTAQDPLGISDFTDNAQILINLGHRGGFATCFDLAQCESTMGNYDQLLATVNGMLEFLNGQPLIVNVNITGNVGHATVPGYMLNNILYGQVNGQQGVIGPGYQGGLFKGPSAGSKSGNAATVRFDVPATAARIAAIGGALYKEFGAALFGLGFTYSEVQGFSNFVPQMTSAAITQTLAGSGGLFDQVRALMPKTFLITSLSFIDYSDFEQMFAATDRNFIAVMAYDTTNEAPVSPGGKSIQVNSMAAFRGGSYVNGTFVPNFPGLFDRRALVAGGGRAFVSHIGADELGNRVVTQSVPPADEGDGTLPAIFAQEQLMQVILRMVYKDDYTGPPGNTIGAYPGQPTNYPGVTWGNLYGFFAGHPVPVNVYSASWPQ